MLKSFLYFVGILFFFNIQAQQQTFNCYFHLNSAEYEADSLVKLKKWIHSYPFSETITYSLVSYTDTIGSLKHNDILAKNRMNNIADVIEKMGYQVSKKEIIGKRYQTTLYTNNDEFRKVEIQMIPKVKENNTSLLNSQLKSEKKEAAPKTNTKHKKEAEKTPMERFEAIKDNTSTNLKIEFQNNTSEYLDKKSADQVFHLSEYLKKYPNKKVVIIGHGCCSDNYKISLNRAKQVYKDLRKYKISKKRMKYKGLSNTDPLVKEMNAKTEQQNRRVEVIFYE